MAGALTVAAGMGLHAAGQYHLVTEIPVGGEGGWDYLSVDSAAHRLYVSHGTRIVVIDTEKNAVVGEIADTPGVHGFAIAADLGKGFSSNGRENTLSVVDLKSLATTKKIQVGENPDAILYEPSSHLVFAMNGRSHSVSVVDATTNGVVATVPVEGKPESAAADPDAHRLYVNLEDRNAIAVIDIAARKVVATWPISPGEEATGMAIDRKTHRLFVGCGNKLMLMVDSTSGKVVASVPAGAGVDATWFDPEPGLAFSSAGDGSVTVAHEDSPSALTVVQTVTTARGARTMALDPVTHRIYLSTAEYGEAAAPGAGGRAGRPPVKPGTFKVLVLAKD
jgi:YVTN family beta-propeller protein